MHENVNLLEHNLHIYNLQCTKNINQPKSKKKICIAFPLKILNERFLEIFYEELKTKIKC